MDNLQEDCQRRLSIEDLENSSGTFTQRIFKICWVKAQNGAYETRGPKDCEMENVLEMGGRTGEGHGYHDLA